MSASRIFNLKNNGSTPLDVLSAEISPANAAFTPTPSSPLPHTLQGQESMTVEVVAASAVLGPQASNLVITHTGYNGPTASAPLSVNFVEPPIGPGSLFWAKVGSTFANVGAISAYVFGDFTFQFWAYTPSTAPSDQFGRYVNNNFITGFAINHKATMKVCIEGAVASIDLDGPDNSASFDTWQAFAFRRSGTIVSLLRNGVVIASANKGASPSLNVFTSGNGINFGNTGGTEISSHYLSDWRMWNVALSDADILANYNKRLTGSETGLVAYYPLSEADSVFDDRTGNNASLTLMSGGFPTPPIPDLRYDPLSPVFIP